MPTYSYECKTCDQIANIVRGMNDPEKVPFCLKCNNEMVKKYQLGAVTFKGTGWGKDA